MSLLVYKISDYDHTAEREQYRVICNALKERFSGSNDFERLQLPQSTLEEIKRACDRIKFEREVFEEWGLYAIMPNPICALNFFGSPGTGKTLATDALADNLGKKLFAPVMRILKANITAKVQKMFRQFSKPPPNKMPCCSLMRRTLFFPKG